MFQAVSDPPAVQEKSEELEVTLDDVKPLGSGHEGGGEQETE